MSSKPQHGIYVIDPSLWRPRAPRFSGTTVALILDQEFGGADMYGGVIVLQPGRMIPLHWHGTGELQFVLSGTGLALGAEGHESPIGPQSVVFSPRGASGAHGFRNTGPLPLSILFFYPSVGGNPPEVHTLDVP